MLKSILPTYVSKRLSHPIGALSVAVLATLPVACETDEPRVEKSAETGDTSNSAADDSDSGRRPDGSTDPNDTDNASPTDSDNPCKGPNPPTELCQMVASGPACGDGEINQATEICDDGNTMPGDGCNGVCKVEPNYECNEPGSPCTLLIACGNGKIEPGEVCDDGNILDDDGCNATCNIQSQNFICFEEGEPCKQVVFCGDSRISGDETCEDDDPKEALEDGDGCDIHCQKEDGWVCPVPGQACMRVEVCGDGKLSLVNGEQCDDGNAKGGDGCSADCKFIEDGYICPSPGALCTNTTRCGDGRVSGKETCDDANEDANDGCNACSIQSGFECPFPGAKCLPFCGDGQLVLNEICDDGNKDDGDGCSSTCEWEKGWTCDGPPGDYVCRKTFCGDGKKEGTESCDDANPYMGDGCTPLCVLEPTCHGGDACTSACGDGLVLSGIGEQCDDGNLADGDGCSAECKVEPGYECKQPPIGESMVIPVVYRDFTTAHPDFEPNVIGLQEAATGLVADMLDEDGKPVYVGGPNAANGHIDSAESFRQWYREVPDENATIVSTMALYDNGKGGYVNRYGENGDQYASTEEEWCGDDTNEAPCVFEYGGTPCDLEPERMVDCVIRDGTHWGVFVAETYDGNPLFFPIDNHPDAITPKSEYSDARVPPLYDVTESWPFDGELHNFHFTSEVLYWFQYNDGQSYTLDFTGDDDVWVFVNNRLAVDLGGIHTPDEGSITLSDRTAERFGLRGGQVYEIKVFQAERQTSSSTYKLTLSGFNSSASRCGPICGDGVLAPGEQCDDGENRGGYGACQPDCTRGPYCGDGVVQEEFEQCDDTENISPYGTVEGGCSPGCIFPPTCGDKIVQSAFGETCDDGVNDGRYGGCTNACRHAPWCGDGVVQDDLEECDDGLNDGTYGNCGIGCVSGPKCGDGIVQTEWGEQCDDGNTEPGDACSPNCKKEGGCGDAFVDTAAGELCDDGENDGGYGECAPGCKPGPGCGDGVVESSINPDTQMPYEQCDDGVNDSGYGECAPGCVLGPHCGDGRVQTEYEECDDGNDDDLGDDCTNSCKKIIVVPV